MGQSLAGFGWAFATCGARTTRHTSNKAKKHPKLQIHYRNINGRPALRVKPAWLYTTKRWHQAFEIWHGDTPQTLTANYVLFINQQLARSCFFKLLS
jgi:hypothetical protein